jgi:DNA-binding Lrp family transcriptional regulator
MVLNETDRQLIAAIQDGLPLASQPYAVIADRLGITQQAVITRLQALQDSGLIKRMGVVVRHRALGYDANAMVVWDVPDADIERIGKLLADETCVTLCYQRPRRLPDWPYNLFCMIHGRARDSVLRCIERIIDSHGLHDVDHDVLFSTRSFKQCGAHYASPAEQAGAARG